ncbi:hypothetical protein H4217_001275 [Coemansia sp. RSA 1939]|nr:hypothetical protein H4217_001275 [Coemansia sp. RSA 1939]KAJ2599888.1 hypothetical protein EV177_007242 [Coemansia sp. RSA 1804]
MTDLKPIKVPGELVLAYALRKYYPARVELQVSPQKYVVRFFDGSKSLLSKKRILTIYDNSFYTCPLGAIQLIGDEPAKQANKRMRGSREEKVNPNNDFEWDKKAFANLIKEAEAIKHHLDALHSCTSDEVCSFDDVEDRMSIFFGNDKSRKQMLTSRVSKGFLNRAEFDFLGRLLNSWYELSPTAARGEARSSGVVAASTDEDANKSKQEYNCSNSQPLQQINSSRDIIEIPGLATNFVHEVLLPHAIKRMTAEREKCSLSEAEIRMAHEDSDTQWVDYILAARVSGMVQQCLKLQ